MSEVRDKRNRKHDFGTIFFVFQVFETSRNSDIDFSISSNVSEQLSILPKFRYFFVKIS